jgi:hypothetical protein
MYLAVQVRQNTAALKTASRQEIVDGMRGHNRLAMEPGAAKAFDLGLRDYPAMAPEDASLFQVQLHDHVLFFQGAFALYEGGTLEEETYQAYLNYIAAQIATPGGGKRWAETSPFYTARMVAALNERLRQGDHGDVLSDSPFVRLAGCGRTPSAGTERSF